MTKCERLILQMEEVSASLEITDTKELEAVFHKMTFTVWDIKSELTKREKVLKIQKQEESNA